MELKNDLSIKGTLSTVDQFLNMKLLEIDVVDKETFPHMIGVKNCFIRGSVIRYAHIPPEAVDVELLQDASRRELETQKQK